MTLPLKGDSPNKVLATPPLQRCKKRIGRAKVMTSLQNRGAFNNHIRV